MDAHRLSPQQRLVWQRIEAGQIDPQDASIRADLALGQTIDAERLARALREEAAHHEILRTRIGHVSAVRTPFQLIERDLGIDIRVREASASQTGLDRPNTILVIAQNGSAQRMRVDVSAYLVDRGGLLRMVERALARVSGGACDAPVQYADVAAWLNDLDESDDAVPARAELAVAEPSERCLVPFGHDAVGPSSLAAIMRPLPAETAQAVRALADNWSVSHAAVYHALHTVLLHRYSSAETIVTGVRTAGRGDPELADVVGPMARVLPMQAEIAPDTRLRGLAAAIERRLGTIEACQDYWPHEDLPPILAHQCGIEAREDWPEGIEPAASTIVEPAEPFVTRIDIDSQLRLQYDSERMSAEAATLMLSQYAAMIEAAIAAPDEPVTRIGPPPAAYEVARIGPVPASLPARIMASADDPERIALTGIAETSYARLVDGARKVARNLSDAGISRGDRVVLARANGPQQIEGFLGIWLMGATCVPIDPAAPTDRFLRIAKAADARAILADGTSAIPAALTDLICGSDKSGDAASPLCDVRPDEPAYIVFTSGTTGSPKGVVVSHGALARYVDAIDDRLSLSVDAELTTVAGIDVDLGYTSLFVALGTGRRYRILPNAAGTDAAVLAEALGDRRPDCLKIVPQHFAGLVTALGRERATALMPTECLVFGGDRLAADTVALARSLDPGCRLFNHYGPTETTVGVLARALGEQASGPYPLGTPLGAVDARVCDGRHRPISDGFPGELWIGGPTLANGYHADPAHTADRFRPDPYATRAGARRYRTGDLVRRLADGAFAFIGRADHQIKFRGVRIELGEIESALRTIPQIVEAVVDLRDDAGPPMLVGYLRTADGEPVARDAIQTALADRLPATMIPQSFVFVASFDRTPSGKIDRRRLADIALNAPTIAGAAPRNHREAVLVEIIADLIKAPRFGIHDNFFEAGGDSIIGIQIAAQARKRGVVFASNLLFKHQTVAELAAAADDTVVVNARQGAITGDSLLLPIQARWVENEHGDPHHFNQSLMVETEAIEEAALATSIGALLDHHDLLRAALVETGQGARLRIGPNSDPSRSVERVDLSELDEPERSRRLNEEAARLQVGLALDGPLFKVGYFVLGENDCRLLLVAHHLVVDAVSWHILLADLFALIEAEGDSEVLPPKTTAFADFADHLHRQASDPQFSRQLPFWTAQCPVEAPPATDDGLSGGDNTFGAARSIGVSVPLGTALDEASISLRSGIEEMILAAYARACAEWADHREISVELENHGRGVDDPSIDLSRTVGWFTARYPVRLSPTDGGLLAWLGAAKAGLRAVPSGGLAYGLLRHFADADGTPPPLADAPIPFCSLNYLGRLAMLDENGNAGRLASEPRGAERADAAHRDHLLALNAQLVGDELRLDLTYAAGHVREDRAQALLDALVGDLETLARSSIDDAGLAAIDFPLARFEDDATLRNWLDDRGIARPADIYPLSPLQQGMAIETLLSPGSGAYVLQLVAEFSGALDADRLAAAWRDVLRAHPALRSTLHDLDTDNPLQVVHADPQPEWHRADWSALGDADVEARIQDWLREDRQAGFDFAKAPLMRFALIRTAQDRHVFVWTRHHAIVDGWSSARVLQQVFETYDGQDGPGAAPPFREYIAWLDGRADAAGDFWRRYLTDFEQATPLSPEPIPFALGSGAADNVALELDAERSERLRSCARANHVTLATLMRAAWGAALARNAGAGAAVLGITMSGRPDDLEGADAIVGPFINTVLARVTLPQGEELGAWLKRAQSDQAELDRAAHSPLSTIRDAIGFTGARMFESLFIFENFPMDREAVSGSGLGSRISAAQTVDKTGSPLTVLVDAADRIAVRFSYNPSQLKRNDAEALRDLYSAAIDAVLAGDAGMLDTLPVPGGTIEERRTAIRAAAPRLVVTASFTPEPIVEPLLHASRMLGFGDTIAHTGNGQIFQDLLDPSGPIGADTGAVIVMLRWHDIATRDGGHLAMLSDGLRAVAKRGVRAVIVALCPPPPGRPDLAADAERSGRSLRETVADLPEIAIFDAATAFAEWSVDAPHDSEAENVADIPYTPAAYAALAMLAVRRLDAMLRPPFKAIVVDADDTLWGGICGEIGAERVDLDGGWADFRAFLMTKRAEGFLLCLCSRNNPEDMAAVFARKDWDMPDSAFAATRIGWGSKADAVVEIAAELGLGIDSLLFLDDDPANTTEVAMRCAATAIAVPDNPDELSRFAQRLWPLDRLRLAAEDRARADNYAVERERREWAEDQGTDFAAFMSSLELAVDFDALEPEYLARAADLIQRTNQFNLTLRRDTLEELRRRAMEEGTVVHVRDRFGDYGLVGVILHHTEGGVLVVENMLLSCRALARGVEVRMAHRLADLAETMGCVEVEFAFRQGERNRPAHAFFEQIPGERIRGGEGGEHGGECKRTSPARLRTMSANAEGRSPAERVQAPGKHRRGRAFYAMVAERLRSADQVLSIAGSHEGRGRSRAAYAAPHGELEGLLGQAYEDILGITDVGRHDSFFGLGGNSLQAVQLVGRIRRVLAADLQLRAVFENPTVQALAEEVALSMPRDGESDEALEVMEF